MSVTHHDESISDLTNLGLSSDAHRVLKELKASGTFEEMVDAYRLGVAIAIALRADPPAVSDRANVFGAATVDQTGKLRTAVQALFPDSELTPYRLVERLANWGVLELERRRDGESIDLSGVVDS